MFGAITNAASAGHFGPAVGLLGAFVGAALAVALAHVPAVEARLWGAKPWMTYAFSGGCTAGGAALALAIWALGS